MLFLVFHAGKDRYALDTGQIEQVLPFLEAKALPGAPAGVAGVINYRGMPVPLIDLSLLATGQPAAAVMSTRVILARYQGRDGGDHRLALSAERVVATIERDAADFVATGVEAGTPAYLGPVAPDPDGLIQWIRVEALLPDDLRAVLFRAGGAAA